VEESKRGFAEPPQIATPAGDSPAAAPRAAAQEPADARAAAKEPADPRTLRLDSTWLASSFDLAQGLDVKVMESKLSRETLDSLFRA
jgi:hypothetical protein